MWNVLRKDVVHIVTIVLSSSVSRVRICDFLLNKNPFVCGHYITLSYIIIIIIIYLSWS